ncbi:MAG TPA: glycosyltransferase [Gaiella sp.]|nr:glycosyltransferase [Gaiella sp.]
MYSHDGLGFGHARRNLAIATALTLAEPEAAVLLATSADEIHTLGIPPRVDVVKLPGLRKVANEKYTGRRLAVGGTGVIAVRNSLLQATVDSFKPAVILADKHPLGARGELLPALNALRSDGGRAVIGFRDILDDPAHVRTEWTQAEIPRAIEEHYDRVLVYGHPAVLDPVKEYSMPRAVAAKLRFCGYVCTPPPVERVTRDAFPFAALTSDPRPSVLATAGGGEDGFAILETFIAAAAGAEWRGVVVAGSQSAPAKRQALRDAAAEAGVMYFTFVRGLDDWFDLVDALVCMGGYNTLAEAVSRGTPTVCIPRVEPRTEQLIRAEAFAKRGLLRYIHPDRLDAAAVRREVDEVLKSSREELAERARTTLGFDGAQQAAAQLLDVARSGAEAPQPAGMR